MPPGNPPPTPRKTRLAGEHLPKAWARAYAVRQACRGGRPEFAPSGRLGMLPLRGNHGARATVESTREMTQFKNYSRLTLFGFWLVGGCASLSGTWRAVDIDPPNATGVIRTMTFDGKRYTATADEGAKRRTTTGDFDWSGSRLTLRTAGGSSRVFLGRKGDGRMTLVDERPAGQVRTTFEKISD